MKKFIFTVIFALLLAFMMPTAALAVSDGYTVDKVDFTADLRSDGSALITEEWTLTFGESGAEGFVRRIDVIDDNFERIAGVSDLSVSVDGRILSEESSESARQGTYSFTKMSDSYFVSWNMMSKNETHVFSMRYVVSDAVKLYNEKAYFYCRVVNEDNHMLCKNVTVTVNTPENCFSEDFEIIESSSLAGEKADGKVTFFSANSVGLIRAGIAMPQSLFDTQKLTLIVDDTSAALTGIIIAAVILLIGLIILIFYIRNYKMLFRRHWKKKCAKLAQYESSYKARENLFQRFSPAEVLYAVSEKTVNEADLFIVTALELVRRGYISASANGFSASEHSDSDSCGRPLNKNEKRVIRIFSSERWVRLIKNPESFCKEIKTFNENVRFISPFSVFTPSGRKAVRYCFEMRLSAKAHEFVAPEEISDDFFCNRKYNVSDLVISIINEYERSLKGEVDKNDTSRFKRDLFMYRKIYDEGKPSVEE